jgi:hypothetical protein
MLHFKSFGLAILATTAIVSVALTGCATTQETQLQTPLPVKTENVTKSANTDNVLKIHEGMASNKILEMFGTPDTVRQSVCGAGVGKPWTCTTWEYGEWASFTFSGGSGSLILNNYEVHRK